MEAIEKRMKKLTKTKYEVRREGVSKQKASTTLKDRNETHTVKLAAEAPDEEVMAI